MTIIGCGMKKKGLSLDEALFLSLKESGNIAFQSINEMHDIVRKKVNRHRA
jgi:hypothetical protein